MIKEKKVLIKITNRNKSYYEKLGYVINDLIDNMLLIDSKDLMPKSKIVITAICKFCKSEHKIEYYRYNENISRNNKGYYSCFECKNIEREKTSLLKFGETSYSKTEDFKKLVRKNNENE